MNSTEITAGIAGTPAETLRPRPQRADARRNYDKVIAAARQAFAETGASTSLEEIARRAEVGIGTLYRHFPNRQDLIEAVYVGEVEDLCRSAADLEALAPWDAFEGWLHRFVAYVGTKQALAQELLNYAGRDSVLFKNCRAALNSTGQPILERAQRAQVVRSDTSLGEIMQMVMGLVKIPAGEPGQIDHMLRIALDGLRYRAPGA